MPAKLLVCIGLCFSLSCYANDSAGTVASGGITFTKTPAISMTREKLSISPRAISINYIFTNNTNQPVTTTLLFPVPPFTGMGPQRSWDPEVIGANPQRSAYLNFSVKSNQQEINHKTITRAVFNNKDITQQLISQGVPLNPGIVVGFLPIKGGTAEKVTAWQKQAKNLGLLDKTGKPLWQKQVTFYWTQTFPANKSIALAQQYRPSPGVFYASAADKNPQHMKDTFGLDLNSLQGSAAIKKWLTQQHTHSVYFYHVRYILTTGANWSGPINDFYLTIKKPKNGVIAYNKFYGNQSVKKTESPTELTIAIKNFTPRKELNIVFGSQQWLQDPQ